ncbi:amidohydrolase family protein [Marispirochaeta sp.]|jgi:6-methylsalicylate decarboxylase|uniref:amidohydrolase family protein n=1 Tax=Marispirochaeta sp. TaxID=2038653 RepID=UPI0029C790F9|nr:amidohydrolase family protein [Marispirochaeta sp.]
MNNTYKTYKIDIHHHFVPTGSDNSNLAAERSLRFMDSHAIKKAYLSLSSPAIITGNTRQSGESARMCNENAAMLKRSFPDRFGAFATLPFPHIDASLKELAYAMEHLKLDGVQLFSHYNGEIPDTDCYGPVLDELNARGSIVFIHPNEPYQETLQDNPAYLRRAEYSFEVSRFVTASLFNGLFETYPKIRYILAHGGGIVPFLSQRISRIHYLKGKRIRWGKVISDMLHKRNKGLEFLQNCYYECSEMMDDCFIPSLLELTSSSHLLYGSNCNESNSDDANMKSSQLPTELFYLNAEELFQ